jgi:hypothetical protein
LGRENSGSLVRPGCTFRGGLGKSFKGFPGFNSCIWSLVVSLVLLSIWLWLLLGGRVLICGEMLFSFFSGFVEAEVGGGFVGSGFDDEFIFSP